LVNKSYLTCKLPFSKKTSRGRKQEVLKFKPFCSSFKGGMSATQPNMIGVGGAGSSGREGELSRIKREKLH